MDPVSIFVGGPYLSNYARAVQSHPIPGVEHGRRCPAADWVAGEQRRGSALLCTNGWQQFASDECSKFYSLIRRCEYGLTHFCPKFQNWNSDRGIRYHCEPNRPFLVFLSAHADHHFYNLLFLLYYLITSCVVLLHWWRNQDVCDRQDVDISFTVCCCIYVCSFVRLQISPARLKLAASNFARWFIGILGRELPILGNYAPPEAQNRTNRPATGK